MNITSGYNFTWICVVLGILAFIGCEEDLDPFKKNDQFVFSIYGYLDASGDNHWIRVINLQEEVNTDGEGINGDLFLIDMNKGNTVFFEDSLFQYSDDVYAYNFWTNYQLEPDQTYRLYAQRADGASSTVLVKMPSTFKDPVFQPAVSPLDPDAFFIEGIDNLADVSLKFKVHYKEANFTQQMSISLLPDTISMQSDRYFIPVERSLIVNATKDLDDVTIFDCEFFVARAGPDWVNFSSLDPQLIALPTAISNVEKGTGYVIGVVSKRIQYPHGSCED